jgi:response regulator RpfG family c-di-GMP phosphodiesterase
MAKLLSELLRKDALFVWTERQHSAFEALKDALFSEQVLAYPNFHSQFILTTDASTVTVAAILSQVQDFVERPISFASRQLNRSETRYSASESEMLAVNWGTRQFRFYLYGKQFVLRTDHDALKYMHNLAGNKSRLLRWSLRLSEFDFVVEHRPGTQIRHVDDLSRAVQAVTQELEITRDEVKTAQD